MGTPIGHTASPAPLTSRDILTQHDATSPTGHTFGLSRNGAEVVDSASDHGPALSSRSATSRPSISWKNLKSFNSDKLESIKNAKTAGDTRNLVNIIRKVVDFLISRLITNYETKSDAAAAIFEAVHNKDPVDAYRSLCALVKPGEHYDIGLERDDRTFKLKIGENEIFYDETTINDTTLEKFKSLPLSLSSMQKKNPLLNISKLQDELEKFISTNKENPEKQEKEEAVLIVDLPRANFYVNNELLNFTPDGDIGKEQNAEDVRKGNFSSFISTVNKGLHPTTEQVRSITTLAHQGTMGTVINALKDIKTFSYLQGTGQSTYTLTKIDNDIALDIKFKTQWQVDDMLEDMNLPPRPSSMKEPKISLQILIKEDGVPVLNKLNFCTSDA